jgi:hypothetical protein
MRQLATAFAMYTNENSSRLPGMRADAEADWLGGSNIRPPKTGRQPEDGTIYKYMGRQKHAYTCPDDNNPRPYTAGDEWFYSYTGHLILAGAQVDALAGAHYVSRPGFTTNTHIGNTLPFDGVPMLVEEDTNFYLNQVDDSGWTNDDAISDRHLKTGAGKGWGNLAFTDTHVGRVQLPPPPSTAFPPFTQYFHAKAVCVRGRGGRWVSGRSWHGGGMYGFMANAPAASTLGIAHPVD